uniref:Transthyretin-like family protein n=1 Tax=Rhabditophanes sp. KR3021 TaxID=114890 RepID=A0AC35TN58_9BILA
MLKLILVFICLLHAFLFSDKQILKMCGILLCDEHRAINVKVQIWDRNYFSKNDLLDSTTTDKFGHFCFDKTESKNKKLDPYLIISSLACYRSGPLKIKLKRYQHYVSQGAPPTTNFRLNGRYSSVFLM